MKRLLAFFMLTALLVASLAACGSSDDPEDTENPLLGQYSKGLAYEVCADDPTTCIITGIGSCTDKNIVIPTYINRMLVVGIADGAFSPKAETIKKATLDRALADASAATDATDSPTASGAANGGYAMVTSPTGPFYAFGTVVPIDMGEGYETGTGTPIDLEKIESVQISPAVKTIGDEAFYGCEELETISTHAQISSIGQDAFTDTAYYNNAANWEGKALYLSNYLLSVDSTAAGEFTVKEGTTLIASYAFSGCEGMTSVTFASSVSYVGTYAFSGCVSLANIVASQTYYSYSNTFDGCISYKPITPGQGGVIITPQPTEEKYPTNFDAISEADFESIKAAPQHVYTYEERLADGGLNILMTNGTTSYYVEKRDNGSHLELYADTDENGLVMYMKRDDGLYFTSATLPNPYAILSAISFDQLVCESEKGNRYVYEDDTTRIKLGFKGGKLVYVSILASGVSTQAWFYDFDKTVVPQIPHENFVPGVYLDENGNAR